MSRFGTVATGAPTTTRTVQSTTAIDLQRRLTQAIAQLPAGHLITDIALSGGGAGQKFFIVLESAAAANVLYGGLMTAVVRCYSGSESGAIDRARAAAVASAPAVPFVDGQLAASSDGHKAMGLLVFGVLAGVGGGQVIQSAYAFPQDPGENQDFTLAGAVELLDGSGTATRLEALLPNPVRPDSLFRFGMYIGDIFPTVIGANGEVAIQFSPEIFGPDDPDFPNNTDVTDFPVGITLGGLVNNKSHVAMSNVIMSQAMLAAPDMIGRPAVGRIGLFVEVNLQQPNGDTVRIGIHPSTWGNGRVFLSVEELDPAGYTQTPVPPTA